MVSWIDATGFVLKKRRNCGIIEQSKALIETSNSQLDLSESPGEVRAGQENESENPSGAANRTLDDSQ
jgi:hypothetical protein